MTADLKSELQQTSALLRDLLERVKAERGHFFDCYVDGENEEARVEADTAGLVYLAYRAVTLAHNTLARNGVPGAHAYFDAFDEDDNWVPDRFLLIKRPPESA